ncbi:Rho GTPase activation protein [Suillus subalutaceus]|uniref:Rho GTPase activation protein n=1 Tax=Suillus subalutaceus TaxID=48586 RepID=UPI001B885498|nr:Rho GTPase activation protein [Suillus subalutaceus]KAG1870768.1 Rho GTPase activation protein [Suillus subalutaceus]
MPSDSPPPTKAGLLKWWTQFTHAQNRKKDSDPSRTVDQPEEEHPVFQKPLKESLRYASVQISTANANGELYVWGYIPVVVAKCGLYLKENATEVEGTFRVNGSNKRMRDLQAAFETPPRYGKSLDWKNEHFTTHDVASVFRRYLTQMPEPVIPHDMYHDFRDVLGKKPFNHDEVIATYKRLIQRMPRANQYLLLYVLDLLSVFARKSDKNLMTATNLAVIFRPGLISHPNHEMSPGEHALSQRVLEFLIAQQDWFLLDIPPPPRSEQSSSWKPPPRPQHAHTQVPSEDDSDLVVVPSSDDEHTSIAGGWKLVGRDRRRIYRRRTTLEYTDSLDRTKDVDSGQLSPVLETPTSRPVSQASSPAAVGVSRSRTLPSNRASTDDEKHRARVLRKQKRTSAQPRHPTAPGGHAGG